MKNLKHFKILLRYLKDQKFLITLYIILSIISYIIPVYISFVWADTFDALVNSKLESFLVLVIFHGAMCSLVWSIMDYPINYIFNKLQARFMYEINKDLYKKINDLPAIGFEEIGTGEFVNRMYTDSDRIMSLLSHLIKLGTRIIIAIILIIISFTISVYAGLELILLALAMYIFANIYYPKVKKMHEGIKKVSDKYVKDITENISGVREIKALGIKDNINNKVYNMLSDLFTKQNKQANSEALYYALNNLAHFICRTLIYATLGYQVIKGQVPLTGFVLFESFVFRIDSAVETISQVGIDFNKIAVSLKRIGEIIDNKLYPDEKFGDKEVTDESINIEFKNVKFKYREDEELILKGLSLDMMPNKKIAIVGRSGEGKSTLFNLLLRYFDPISGKILVNGIDLKDLSEKNLRDNISIIRQTPFLFNDTIFNNFKMVKEDVTLEEIREVCKKAYIDKYIIGLKDGYDTVIGEGGINLSGGQKQRLAIARTLLKDSKVILFDEATSALDNESQNYIKETIDSLVKNHTIIIVAHRLSTIMDADLIYVVGDGKVVASGTHRELMKSSKEYSSLYQSEVID